MIRNVRKAFTALLALLALLGAGRAALAVAHEDEVARQRVSYTDLNLDRAGDAAKLYARLEHAAAHVCYADLGAYAQMSSARRACAHRALADAVAHVGHPNLTAVHVAHVVNTRQITARR